MKILNNCPLCNSEQIIAVHKIPDHFLSGQVFTVSQCNECGFRFTNPRPNADALGAYYQSNAYIAHSNTQKGFIAFTYQRIRNYTIHRKIARISALHPAGSLLDIGCATGEFLAACRKKGWKVTGVEPDEKAASFATQHFHLNVFPETALKTFADGSFEVITLWHVLEHVDSLHERVEEIYRLLAPGGLAVVAVPNPACYDAHHYGTFWAAWDVPRHLSHFSPSNMISLFCSSHGFRYLKSFPMLFDAFYISMLSEKYRSRKMHFFRALSSGIVSNFNAMKTGQYSSLTYIFIK